jgi:hypothetical protein
MQLRQDGISERYEEAERVFYFRRGRYRFVEAAELPE